MTEAKRHAQVDQLVAQVYGPPNEEKIGHLTGFFERVETRMFEIIRIFPDHSVWMDMFEDDEFKPVMIPEALRPVLRQQDCFLGSIGYRDGRWTVLHLNPGYWRF